MRVMRNVMIRMIVVMALMKEIVVNISLIHLESVAMQLRTCELTLTAHMAVSHTLQCAADKHSGDCALTLKQLVAQ